MNTCDALETCVDHATIPRKRTITSGLPIPCRSAKTIEQQDLQATHRMRASLMDRHKAKGNQIRGLTSEYGLGHGAGNGTALLATICDASQFANSLQMAASLGLTSKQNSSGGKERLLGISKRGVAYLRSLLVNGQET